MMNLPQAALDQALSAGGPAQGPGAEPEVELDDLMESGQIPPEIIALLIKLLGRSGGGEGAM